MKHFTKKCGKYSADILIDKEHLPEALKIKP